MKYPELSYALDFFRIQVIFMMEENMRLQANNKPISKQKNPSLQNGKEDILSAVAERSP